MVISINIYSDGYSVTFQMMQQDFVESRQADKEAMTQEDFQSLLVLARILAISYGLSDLTPELWSKAKQMEEHRKLRLSS